MKSLSINIPDLHTQGFKVNFIAPKGQFVAQSAIFCNRLSCVGQALPADVGREAGDILDESAVHHRAR